MKYLILLAASVIALAGCQNATTRNTDSGVPDVATDISEVSPVEAQKAVSKAYSQFIDVRSSEEYAAGHAARAENIPLERLSSSLAQLSKSEPVYIICETGNRSKNAAEVLKQAGFKNVVNVTGGTVAWKAAGLPVEDKSPHKIPNPLK